MRYAATLSVFLLIACGGRDARNAQSPTTSSGASAQAAVSNAALTPEQLGDLGARIRKEPSRAHDLLVSRGLTEKSFEKAIREVTENPDASKRYAAAYRKASS